MSVLEIYTDGGSRGNPGEAAIGVVFFDGSKKVLSYKEKIGVATNNVAEYVALHKAFEFALKERYKRVHCHMDSQLVTRQLTGEYQVKDNNLQELFVIAKELELKFEEVKYVNVPREHVRIAMADKLVNEALDGKE